jgi:hypothetical protein
LPWLAGNRIILTMKAWTKPYGDRIDRAGLLLSLAILLGAMGCEDKNPLGDDFGVDLPEPLTVSWGDEENYHASSGSALVIAARASVRVDWRVEITSNSGGRVIRDDRIIQTRLGFTETLPFVKDIQHPDVFSVGDLVTVQIFTTPEIRPSQADRAQFQFEIHP